MTTPSLAVAPPPQIQAQYNYIFKDLVSDDNDFVGMVAYTIYKRQKIEWIEAFKAQHGGTDPSDQDVADGFSAFSKLPSQVEQYRDQAVQLIDSFLEATLAEQAKAIETALRDDAVVKAAGKSFWQSVAENVVANLIAVVLTAGLTGLAWVMVTGPSKLLKPLIDQVFGTN